MSKALLLRLHRWLTLVFALPLAAVILSGLVLSFEPAAQILGTKPGSLTADRVIALLAQHDPEGKARSISFRTYENRLSIGGVRPGDTIDVDVVTGEELTEDGALSNLFYYSRALHETLLIGFGWLVQLSTIAMVVLIVIGIAMGWPRFANTVSGWHKGVAWGLLPLLVLSPLTGLFVAWGINIGWGPAATRGAPITLVEAVRQVGQAHDLSSLVWIRGRNDRLLARVVENGEYRLIAVSSTGPSPLPRNWARLFHEGNFAGLGSVAMNVVISIAFIALMTTGLIIWARRRFRKRQPRPGRGIAPAVTTA